MIKKYLGVSIAVLVFCLQNILYSQIVSTEGVDYRSRRLSVFEQDQDQAVRAYARARFLLADQETPVDSEELKVALRRALRVFPNEGELLPLLVGRHMQSRTPEALYDILKDLSAEGGCSPRFVEGASLVLGEYLQRPDLGLQFLSGFLSRNAWEDGGGGLFPVLFRLSSLCLESGAGAAQAEELLTFLQPDLPRYLTSLRLKLLLADSVLQYRLYLRKQGRSWPASWQEVRTALMKEISGRLEELDTEELFMSALRVLAMNDDNGGIAAFLKLPEIRRKFGGTKTWYRFAILSAAILKDYAGAGDLLEEGLRLNALETQELYSLGRNFVRNNLPERAVKVYEYLLAGMPGATNLRIIIARLYYFLQKPMKGIAVLMPVNPLPADGYVILGHLWERAGNSAKGWQCFSKADKLFAAERPPRQPDAFFYVSAGLSAYKSGHRDGAVRCLQKAHRMAPKDAGICNSLGYVLADYNMDLKQAEKLLAYALKNSGADNPAVMDSVAWLFYRQNRLDEAVKMMVEVLKLSRAEAVTDPEIRAHAREIFRKAGLLKLADFYR